MAVVVLRDGRQLLWEPTTELICSKCREPLDISTVYQNTLECVNLVSVAFPEYHGLQRGEYFYLHKRCSRIESLFDELWLMWEMRSILGTDHTGGDRRGRPNKAFRKEMPEGLFEKICLEWLPLSSPAPQVPRPSYATPYEARFRLWMEAQKDRADGVGELATRLLKDSLAVPPRSPGALEDALTRKHQTIWAHVLRRMSVEFIQFEIDTPPLPTPLKFGKDVWMWDKGNLYLQPQPGQVPKTPQPSRYPQEKPVRTSKPVPQRLAKIQERTLTLRFQILKRDNYRCRLCGAAASDGEHVRLEVDHITPRSQGGADDPINLWTLCFACNRGKGVQPL